MNQNHLKDFSFLDSEYPCEMIPILNVVLFKTADSSLDIREKAAQLLQLLERYSFMYLLNCCQQNMTSNKTKRLKSRKRTLAAMITRHFHLQPQYRYELFHIYISHVSLHGKI